LQLDQQKEQANQQETQAKLMLDAQKAHIDMFQATNQGAQNAQ
jgi:hypothetical protein